MLLVRAINYNNTAENITIFLVKESLSDVMLYKYVTELLSYLQDFTVQQIGVATIH